MHSWLSDSKPAAHICIEKYLQRLATYRWPAFPFTSCNCKEQQSYMKRKSCYEYFIKFSGKDNSGLLFRGTLTRNCLLNIPFQCSIVWNSLVIPSFSYPCQVSLEAHTFLGLVSSATVLTIALGLVPSPTEREVVHLWETEWRVNSLHWLALWLWKQTLVHLLSQKIMFQII